MERRLAVLCACAAALAAATGDDSRRLESGGTPIYDMAHHTWGYDGVNMRRDSTFLSFFVFLLIVALVAGSGLSRRFAWLPEACVVLLVGVVAGLVCKEIYDARTTKRQHTFFTKPLLGFDNSLFFLALLPPIIFHSGYELRPRWLAANFGTIASLAALGTLASSVVVAVAVLAWSSAGGRGVSFAECLSFGALVSATDPVSVLAVFAARRVDRKLFYLVFGESVLNDAVGIVLFKTFSKHVGSAKSSGGSAALIACLDFFVIFGGSMVLGAALAALCAGLLRLLRLPRGGRDADATHAAAKLQVAVLAIFVFAPAFVAELVEMSGIVTTLFAAMGARHWCRPNLVDDARASADAVFATLAHLADAAVFLYLGLSLPFANWARDSSASLVLVALVACLVGRASHVYPIAHAFNRKAAPGDVVPPNFQHMLWFSGLRGAVAFSCAHAFPNDNGHRDLFATTTSALIVVTMLVGGATTDAALRALAIPTGCGDGADPPRPAHFGCLAAVDAVLYPCLVAPDIDPVTPRGEAEAHSAGAQLELAPMAPDDAATWNPTVAAAGVA